MRRAFYSICDSATLSVPWYGRSMLEGRVVVHRDYEVLRKSRESVDERSDNTCC